MRPSHIRVISVCVFRQGGPILVFEGFDSVKGTHYYRPLGGGVEPGETTADAVRREIREELGREVTHLRLLGTLENLFVCDGRPGHEIVFVYDGRFADASAYEQDVLAGVEDNGEPLHVVWRTLDSFDAQRRLVPEGLFDLLNAAGD